MDGPSIIGLSGQMALQRQLEVTANNMANANSAGYRADRMLFQSHLNRLAVPGNQVAFVQDRATYIDRSQGAIETTGNPLDLAIDGPGYFSVTRPGSAEPGFTRDGRFKRSPQNTLVDTAGRTVRDEGGGQIQIPEDATSIEIRADGNVLASVRGIAQPLGRIGLFTATRPDAVQKAGDGLINIPRADAVPVDPQNRATRIVQGAVEGSTVQAVRELANLTELQRAYEQMQRVISDDDSRIKRMIETVGRNN